MWNSEDRKFMEMALDLASGGLGHVNPNPLVGAVIVILIISVSFPILKLRQSGKMGRLS